MINDYERVQTALSAVDWQETAGVPVRISRGWPKTFERLPLIAVMEASNRHVRHADDIPTVDEVETDIRVFGIEGAVVDAVSMAADRVMERALGYRRVLCYEDGGAQAADVRMKLMRYRKYFLADWDD